MELAAKFCYCKYLLLSLLFVAAHDNKVCLKFTQQVLSLVLTMEQLDTNPEFNGMQLHYVPFSSLQSLIRFCLSTVHGEEGF